MSSLLDSVLQGFQSQMAAMFHVPSPVPAPIHVSAQVYPHQIHTRLDQPPNRQPKTPTPKTHQPSSQPASPCGCVVCCQEYAIKHEDYDAEPEERGTRQVFVGRTKSKREACEELQIRVDQEGDDLIRHYWKFKHSGHCDNPCDGKELKPIWICNRPLGGDEPWRPKKGVISHSFVVCRGDAAGPADEHGPLNPDLSDKHWCWGVQADDNETPGCRVPNEEYRKRATCTRKMVCPEEYDEKCDNPICAFGYAMSSTNCHKWANEFGYAKCDGTIKKQRGS